jgi:hypothetical protein
MAYNSFVRALSPSVAATSSVAPGALPQAQATARHLALQAGHTVEELIAMIPSDYRLGLADAMHGIAATAGKLWSAKSTVARWIQHQSAGTYPSHMRIKAPEVQLTRAFAEDASGVQHRQSLLAAHKTYQDQLLANGIRAKQDDVRFLEASLTAERLFNELLPIVEQRGKELVAASKSPNFRTDQETREVTLIGWEESEATIATARHMVEDVLVYAFRVIAIVEARETVMAKKITKKKELAKSADIEMADATKPGPSMQSMIDKAISKRLKNTGGSKQVSGPFGSYAPTDQRSSCAETRAVWKEETLVRQRPSLRGSQTAEALHAQARAEGSESNTRRRRLYGQKEKEKEDGFCWSEEVGQGERKGESVVAFIDVDPNWISDYRLIPDELLIVPFPVAVSNLIFCTPVSIIQANSYKNLIHRGPNVNLPLDIELDLSVGLKYLFPRPRNSDLILKAWTDFATRLRWRIYFAFTQEETPYDPEFEVAEPPKKDVKLPILPYYLERGLLEGRRFVYNTIAKIPQETERPCKSLMPDHRRIKEFLISNNYVVTMTDKNLGVAVSERTWLDGKCLELLADRNNYVQIHDIQMQQFCNDQCKAMEELAELADQLCYHTNSDQISKFFRSLKTEEGKPHVVPTFYGIPKIHKEPVKVRPIIPCHSAIQNPAAKFCSKLLKPIIESVPTNIIGSKDMALKLSKLKLLPNRQWYFVTGDVVAYYPNIPLDECLNIALKAYEYCYSMDTEVDRLQHKMFAKALKVGNRNLILQYNKKHYLQKNGLAMGVSDSPDLAILYGWRFEHERGVMTDPQIPFYGRYIDDIGMIVYASSEAEAMTVANSIKFDGCTIEWNVSNHYTTFLDMTLYRDENNCVQHMPFRKQRSHQERIPWISHHPIDVKRGTYIGEMSRLATLCSLRSHYVDAIHSLCSLYLARGYPKQLVLKWTKDNMQTRWHNRLTVKEKREHNDVLVLKSEFNTAWNYFNAKELGDTIIGYWRGWLAAAEAGQFTARFPDERDSKDLSEAMEDVSLRVRSNLGDWRIPDIRKTSMDRYSRVIVSRKRTRNLFDLTSLWKKTVLTTLDNDAFEPEENVIRLHRRDSDSDMDVDDPDKLFDVLGYRQLV